MSKNPGRTFTSGALRMPALLLCSALLSACGASGSAPEAEPPKPSASGASAESKRRELDLSAEEAARAGVRVEIVQAQAANDLVTVTATIKANQDRLARIGPRVEGRLTKVAANLGDQVRAGQVLATLDSVAVGEAQSAWRQAQAGQRVAQADFQRAQSLAAEEIVPQKELLRARADLDKANAELRASQDKLHLLGASGGEVDFALRSPIAGTVIEKKAMLGELATPSEPVFTVADLSKVWIEANLTENLLARVHRGASATVTVSAYPGVRFGGEVTYIAGVLDKASRSVPARIEVDNREGRLKPEMFATATIDTGASRGNVLSVPDAAIVLLQGQPTVFVQDGAGYEPRAIEAGDRLGDQTVIRSGLKAGDKVVTTGAYALKARLLKSQISAGH